MPSEQVRALWVWGPQLPAWEAWALRPPALRVSVQLRVLAQQPQVWAAWEQQAPLAEQVRR